MRRLLIATTLIVMATSAVADPYNHRHPLPQRRPYEHRQHSIMPWVAGAVGLGVLGAIIANQPERPVSGCWNEMVGYDRWGNEVWKRYCN